MHNSIYTMKMLKCYFVLQTFSSMKKNWMCVCGLCEITLSGHSVKTENEILGFRCVW